MAALFSLLLLPPLVPLVPPDPGPPPLGVVLESLLLLLDLLPPMKVVAGADVGVPADSNAFGRGLALESSDRIGRNVRTPVAGGTAPAVLSAVSSERVFASVSCLSEALILSGLRGGGSGGSDEAAIVTVVPVPALPFNCMASYGGGDSRLLAWPGLHRLIQRTVGSLARYFRRLVIAACTTEDDLRTQSAKSFSVKKLSSLFFLFSLSLKGENTLLNPLSWSCFLAVLPALLLLLLVHGCIRSQVI